LSILCLDERKIPEYPVLRFNVVYKKNPVIADYEAWQNLLFLLCVQT